MENNIQTLHLPLIAEVHRHAEPDVGICEDVSLIVFLIAYGRRKRPWSAESCEGQRQSPLAARLMPNSFELPTERLCQSIQDGRKRLSQHLIERQQVGDPLVRAHRPHHQASVGD